MAYIGSSANPMPVAFAAVQSQSFNGTGSQTAFTISRSVPSAASLEVLVNNVQQSPYDGSYSVNGTTLTFSEAPSSGTNNVYVIYRDQALGSLVDQTAYRKDEVDAFTVKLTGAQTVAGIKTFSDAPVMPVANLTGDIAAARIANALNASGSAPVYACRAWVNFNGTGTVAIRASGNVSSITDNAVGNYRVNFTTAMPDANYSAVITTGTTSTDSTWPLLYIPNTANGGAPTTTSVGINTGYVSGSTQGDQDQIRINVAIFR